MMYKCVKNYIAQVKCLFRKKSSVIQNVKVNETNVRPFEEIPGPKGLPFIGTFHKYLPIIGEYEFDRLHLAGAKKLASYGPLVKETIVDQTIVWVFRPQDIAEIFRSEFGKIPARKSHLALEKYRNDRKSIYNHGGLITTNGEEWVRIRREFQKLLSKPQEVVMYLEDVNLVVDQFIKFLCKEQDREDVSPILARLFLESLTADVLNCLYIQHVFESNNPSLNGCSADSSNSTTVSNSASFRSKTIYLIVMCKVAFDEKMDSFSEEEMREDSKSSKLIEAAFISTITILQLDNMFRLWRYFETPLYKKMRKSQEFMESIAVEMVEKKKMKLSNLSKDHKLSLLETYLLNPALDEKDVVGMACDILLGGVDTSLYTISFTLYHLATNLDKQEKLYREALSLLPNKNDPVTAEVLNNAKYVKAVLKESFRLNPIAIGVGRILQSDIVLCGYELPKGTNVVFQNQVICRSSKYFEDPDSFIPERWLRDKSARLSYKGKLIHPYAVLPFGHGPRSCIARRLAEQNIHVILLKMCRNFKFTWRGGNLGIQSYVINKPDGPINLKFEER